MNPTHAEYIRRTNLVLDYIGQHLEHYLDLDELAEIAMFSKFHFHRVFKAIVGETVQEYVRRVRLEKAANMLVYSPNSSVVDIALACGYSSQSNFAKAFKKKFGVSATEMRNLSYDSNPGIIESNSGKVRTGYSEYVSSVKSTDNSSEFSIISRKTMQVEVKTLPPQTVAYVRSIGPYHPSTIGKAFDRLCQWAGPRGLLKDNPQFVGISWDNPDITPPEKCRYDASVVIPRDTDTNGDIGRTELEGSLYAVYHCEVHNWQFAEAWNTFYKQWLPDSGYQPDDRPVLELYFSEDVKREEGSFILDLCLPVKPL